VRQLLQQLVVYGTWHASALRCCCFCISCDVGVVVDRMTGLGRRQAAGRHAILVSSWHPVVQRQQLPRVTLYSEHCTRRTTSVCRPLWCVISLTCADVSAIQIGTRDTSTSCVAVADTL
jgi:hypothetical protein